MGKRYRDNAYSSDPDSHSDTSSLGLGYPDDVSLDEWGQPKGGGVGQGYPCDENGRYIYSQIGMPAVPSPSTPSPASHFRTIDEAIMVSDQY
jgi:hypothetical protein